jgi:hypothetical protein
MRFLSVNKRHNLISRTVEESEINAKKRYEEKVMKKSPENRFTFCDREKSENENLNFIFHLR